MCVGQSGSKGQHIQSLLVNATHSSRAPGSNVPKNVRLTSYLACGVTDAPFLPMCVYSQLCVCVLEFMSLPKVREPPSPFPSSPRFRGCSVLRPRSPERPLPPPRALAQDTPRRIKSQDCAVSLVPGVRSETQRARAADPCHWRANFSSVCFSASIVPCPGPMSRGREPRFYPGEYRRLPMLELCGRDHPQA